MPAKTHLNIRAAVAALALATVPVAAFAQGTEEQQQACTPDAVKLCSDTIPDIPKTTACMKAHFSQLAPRCQAAFNDATGGKKTKAAERSPEAPRAKVVTRAERRLPEREARVPRGEREVRAPASRDNEREMARPPREATETPDATPPRAEGYPAYPSPDGAPATTATGTRGQIANACRAGLIDSFTCSTTVPALLGGPSY